MQPRSGKCFNARGEEDTEWENKTEKTSERPPIGVLLHNFGNVSQLIQRCFIVKSSVFS